MRKYIVAGNWKMNLGLAEAKQLATEVGTAVKESKDIKCDVILAPPALFLVPVTDAVANTGVKVSAQNCADKPKGAFTGEISAAMLKSANIEYSIIGHSERRAYYHETDEILNTKVKQLLENDRKIIFCVGEELSQRDNGNYLEVIAAQLQKGLFNLTKEEFASVVVAYEPVWAIGTGRTATADQAQEVHAFIRSKIAEAYDKTTADDTTILYGGSCNDANAKELFAQPDIDGGLIGGAALVAEKFLKIIQSF